MEVWSAAAELQDRTSRAYESYRAGVEARFLSRPHAPGASVPREIAGRPAGEDGIISIPGGLIHHWIGSGFIRGVNMQTAIEVSRDYPEYPKMYREVLSARVLQNDGDRYRIAMRVKESESGITAVLDVHTDVRYVFPDMGQVLTISHADEIREVEHAGTAREKLLPAGRDNGYLWRADLYSAFVETPDGVYLEMETLALSRAFPPMLGWIIEPIARRIGRKSVVRSIEQFQAAALAAASAQ